MAEKYVSKSFGASKQANGTSAQQEFASMSETERSRIKDQEKKVTATWLKILDNKGMRKRLAKAQALDARTVKDGLLNCLKRAHHMEPDVQELLYQMRPLRAVNSVALLPLDVISRQVVYDFVAVLTEIYGGELLKMKRCNSKPASEQKPQLFNTQSVLLYEAREQRVLNALISFIEFQIPRLCLTNGCELVEDIVRKVELTDGQDSSSVRTLSIWLEESISTDFVIREHLLRVLVFVRFTESELKLMRSCALSSDSHLTALEVFRGSKRSEDPPLKVQVFFLLKSLVDDIRGDYEDASEVHAVTGVEDFTLNFVGSILRQPLVCCQVSKLLSLLTKEEGMLQPLNVPRSNETNFHNLTRPPHGNASSDQLPSSRKVNKNGTSDSNSKQPAQSVEQLRPITSGTNTSRTPAVNPYQLKPVSPKFSYSHQSKKPAPSSQQPSQSAARESSAPSSRASSSSNGHGISHTVRSRAPNQATDQGHSSAAHQNRQPRFPLWAKKF